MSGERMQSTGSGTRADRVELGRIARAHGLDGALLAVLHGEDAVIRILDKQSMSEEFAQLSLDVCGFEIKDKSRLRRFIKEPYGMVLVTGPTGSGKTTTLYAALSEIRKGER